MTDQQNSKLTRSLLGNEPSINAEAEQLLLASLTKLLNDKHRANSEVSNFDDFAHGVFMGLFHVPGLSSQFTDELRKAVDVACETPRSAGHQP